MAPAVPLIAVAAGAAAKIAIGSTLLSYVAGFVVSAAINQLGSRLASKKPKSAAFTADAQGRSIVIRSSVESHKIVYGRAKVSGPLVFVATTNTGSAVVTAPKANKMLHMVLPLAGHELQEIETIYLNDLPLTLNADGFAIDNGPYFQSGTTANVTGGSSYVLVHKHLGTDTQAADNTMVSEAPGWTVNHRLRGIAYLYLRLEYSADVFPTGIPNVSAVVKGKKLYDPRTGLTTWTDNAALCIRDYLTASNGFACESTEINDDYFTAAANVSEENVTLVSGSTVDRYTCNGVVDTAIAPLENLQQLVTSLAGAVTYVQGKFRCHAAAFDSSSGAITTDMLAGPVRLQARAARKELFNAVKGTYVDPNKSWQPTDFPVVTNSTYETQDAGERIAKDIELPFTTHPESAQRIAKILFEKARQGQRLELPLNHSALKHAVYDTVTFTDSQLGLSGKLYRIQGMSLGVPGPITLSLQEETSASYDWNAGEASTVDAAPDTDLPNPFDVRPPKALTVTEELYVTRDGAGVKSKAIVTWLESFDSQFKEYQPEYRLSSATDWTLLPRTTATTTEVLDINPGIYDFRVKAVSQLGVSSDYSTTSAALDGLLDPPAEPQNLTISTIGGLAILRWDRASDLDVRIGGHIVFRHSPDTAAAWSQTTTIGNAVPGSDTHAVLPLKPGAYLAKAVDSSGIESTLAATVITTQATALAYANVDTLTEDPTFSGAKTHMIVDGSVLKMASAGQFDGIPDFDAVADLDLYGGLSTVGVYDFSAGIDLGSVTPVRLTSHVLASIAQVFDTIDSRASNIDDWEFFDGDSAAEGDAVVYARSTDDDPAGTPAWGAWNRLDSGEFNARAFEFKLEASVTDGTYNISISELEITVDEVA